MKIANHSLKKICLNCLGLLGDVLIRTTVIEAIAQHYPAANITVIVEPGRDVLLHNHPAVNNIIIFNRKKTPRLSYLKNLYRLIKQLRQTKFDLFINLYGGGSSAFITGLSKASHRFGFYYKKKHASYYTHAIAHPLFTEHWGKSFGLLLEPLGITPANIRSGTTFIPTQAAYQQADTIIATTASPWVLINLGAGDVRKIWPIANYVALAKWLVDKYQYHIGVFLNVGQEYLSKEFNMLYGHSDSITYLPALSLDVIGALMQRAAFVISGDTGLLHLAFGVKAATLALFTYTRPEQVMPEDCVCIACFVEDPHLINEHGVPGGSVNIPLGMVQTAIEQLQKKLSTVARLN